MSSGASRRAAGRGSVALAVRPARSPATLRLVLAAVVVVIAGVVVFFVVRQLTSSAASIVGTWTAQYSGQTDTMQFNNGGTGVDTQSGGTAKDFTYKLSGDKLTVSDSGSPAMPFTYSLSGDNLTLIAIEYTRAAGSHPGSGSPVIGNWTVALPGQTGTLQLSTGGTGVLTDPTDGQVSLTYTLSGSQISLTGPNGLLTLHYLSSDDALGATMTYHRVNGK